MELVYFLIIGAVSGWLAGQIIKGGGFGVVGNIIVGVVGAIVGGWLLAELGMSIGEGLAGQIGTAVIGAVVLLFLVGLIKKK